MKNRMLRRIWNKIYFSNITLAAVIRDSQKYIRIYKDALLHLNLLSVPSTSHFISWGFKLFYNAYINYVYDMWLLHSKSRQPYLQTNIVLFLNIIRVHNLFHVDIAVEEKYTFSSDIEKKERKTLCLCLLLQMSESIF